MNRNLFLKEMRRNAFSLIIWMISHYPVDFAYHVGVSYISGKPVKDPGDDEPGSKRCVAVQRHLEFQLICFLYWDFMLSIMSST